MAFQRSNWTRKAPPFSFLLMSRVFKATTEFKSLLADRVTPVSIYLSLRDLFPNTCMLESADYHSRENSMSYICLDQIAGIRLENGKFSASYPNGTETVTTVNALELPALISEFCASFASDPSISFRGISNGLFGYLSYDCVQYFEDISLENKVDEARRIPELSYQAYRFIIAINHFKNELHVFRHSYPGDQANRENLSLDKLCSLIQTKDFATYKFQPEDGEKSNFTDEEFLDGILHVKEHIQRGDIFQMQLSRRFSKNFEGDDFNVYRALRSINPSPYLFFFDYGDFRIFGSSPESQIIVEHGVASINPIAGTFKRSGNDLEDTLSAERLLQDPKENAEHVMLVDLARNDLSRHCSNVKVKKYKEVQFYSHVIHLVSQVSGNLRTGSSTMEIVADTFPAGTLSGAPKYRTLELIDRYENGARGIYGGAIGHLGFDGGINHAILIRSFLSKNNVLYYQAAGGIVAGSVKESELNEVTNKLMALKQAISLAATL